MKEFIKEIEIIEGIQTDTRAGCLLMLLEIKKLKKRINEDINKNKLIECKHYYEQIRGTTNARCVKCDDLISNVVASEQTFRND